MKSAFILAAGLGTRLKPLTDDIPKCLVSVGGKPLLAIWLDWLQKHGITSVLINSHHLHEKMVSFVQNYEGDIEISLVYEETLLGSAGTLKKNKDFVSDENGFLIVYADNLTNIDIDALWKGHCRLGQLATLGLFQSSEPKNCGIALLDKQGIIEQFEEKPISPKSNLAFAGVAIATTEFLEEIPNKVPCDLARDVIERLLGRMAGIEIQGYLRDIGTLESLAQAEKDWAELKEYFI